MSTLKGIRTSLPRGDHGLDDQAAAVVVQLNPTLDPDTARSSPRTEADLGIEHGAIGAVYRAYAAKPPHWFAVSVATAAQI